MVRTLITTAILLVTVSLSGCKDAENIWNEACDLYEAYEVDSGRAGGACDSVEAPNVVFMDMDNDNIYGYFDGGDTVYVNEDLPNLETRATVIHEMVHYLDAEWLGLEVPGPTYEICMSEDKAWFLEGVWWGSQGYPEEARPEWWTSYPWCWQYMAPTEYLNLMEELFNFIGIDFILYVQGNQHVK